MSEAMTENSETRAISIVSAQARQVLMEADFFAVGPIGPKGCPSPGELAVINILDDADAEKVFLELLARAKMPGQLYALIGLRLHGYASMDTLLAEYRERTDVVVTQSCCFRRDEPVRDVIAQIATCRAQQKTQDEG
jgi:hypothetical protein